MKAIIQDSYGSAEMLELRDVEKPRPGDDELLGPAFMLRASTQECGI